MAFLVDEWAPTFAHHLATPRHRLLDLSVPQMLDHMNYLIESSEGGPGGDREA